MTTHSEQLLFYRELAGHLLRYDMVAEYAEVSVKLAKLAPAQPLLLTPTRDIWNDEDEEKEKTHP